MPAWTDRYAGLRSVVLSGGGLTAVVLPDVGAKIISLVSERTGREFVWRDPTRPLAPIPAGTRYADHDASGIDDCFPTVDACTYPVAPFAGVALGDHGDLWSQRWSATLSGDEVVCTVAGGALPVSVEKRIRIDTRSLVVENTLTLTGAGPLSYQWTGHPLLRAEPGTLIRLPTGSRARTAFSTGDRLSVGETAWSWPLAPGRDGGERDVSRVGGRDDGLNEKYWLDAPEQGCVLEFPGAEEQLHVRFDPVALPFLGVCVNYGGWPAQDPGHWVAVEPSTSPYDSLAETVAAGLGRELAAGQPHLWTWSLQVVGRT